MTSFVFDMDGTVYIGERPIPGAVEFISELNRRGIDYRFLTNNSSHGRRFYSDRLTRMGFDIDPSSILTSTAATAAFVKDRYPGCSVYPVGVPDFVEEIGSAGIPVDGDDPDIVLLAFDRTITYDKINRAYKLLKKGKTFIATHPDNLCPAEDGYDIDIGPFIRMFEQMTGAEATVVGKPNPAMLEMAAKDMGCGMEDIVMVGDRLYTDIRMAYDCGVRSVAVLSGEMTREDISGSDIVPTYICDSVSDILRILPELG
ncbi:MAG: HAD-IIA family hydrolase [Candidatus Methanomethylophilaceae archaeon]